MSVKLRGIPKNTRKWAYLDHTVPAHGELVWMLLRRDDPSKPKVILGKLIKKYRHVQWESDELTKDENYEVICWAPLQHPPITYKLLKLANEAIESASDQTMDAYASPGTVQQGGEEI